MDLKNERNILVANLEFIMDDHYDLGTPDYPGYIDEKNLDRRIQILIARTLVKILERLDDNLEVI